jgi:hypothetical protein
MPTYSLDPLHPDRLRCDGCGRAVARASAGLAATEHLTMRQLARAGLDGVGLVAVSEHDVLCLAGDAYVPPGELTT